MGFFLIRDSCFKPQDVLFNWNVRKDPPGTVKPDVPRVIVKPAPITTKHTVLRKKSARRTCRVVSAQRKLVLDPCFWSQAVTDTPRAPKQRILFECRRTECAEQFHSVRNRDRHEAHCMIFDKVLILNQRLSYKQHSIIGGKIQ